MDSSAEKEKKLQIAVTLKNDFEKFYKLIFDKAVTDSIPEFHRTIYNHLLSQDRVAIAAPRGFAKSKIVSVFYPTYCALFGIRKDITIISASEALAIDLLRQIKHELEGNQDILYLFGDVRSPKWTENHIILKNGCVIRAKGAGAQIRGYRPDCIILDDIETDESVLSEEQRKKLKDWLFRACLNTLLPKGQFIIIGTILHPLSILNDLLETPNGWTKERFKAYRDGVEKEGYELWAEARPHEWLQKRKAEIGSFAFASEFMNDPKLDSSAPIKDNQIRYWDDLPKQFSTVITIDPAYSDDDKADYKVASLVAIDHNLNRYLVTYIRTHAPMGEFIDSVLNLYLSNKTNCTGIGIPNSGTEKSFFQAVVNRANERKIYPPFVELSNTFITGAGKSVSNKKARIIASLQPLFEQGKYYIHPDHYEVREELLTIGSSRWDDLTDTLAYAEQILQPHWEEPKIHEFDDEGYLIENDTSKENYGL